MTYVRRLDQKDDVSEIIMYLQDAKGNYELSPALQRKVELMTLCRDLIRQYGSRTKVVPMLMKEESISPRLSHVQADRIFLETTYIFNTTQTSNRDFWIDIAIGDIKESRRKAMIKPDLKVVAMCDANLVKLIALMTDSKEAEIYKQINIVPRVVRFDPGQTGVSLPDDWEQQIDRIVQRARMRDFTNIPEATVVDEPGKQ